MGITHLGHTGIWVYDLATMVDFYTGILGLHVTDEDERIGIVFLSSRPEEEHHELVLQRGRKGDGDTKVLHQISWRLDSLETLQSYYAILEKSSVRIQQTVTHGNAFGIYFFDPEDNRNEVYWMTGKAVAQPFRRSINLAQESSKVLEEAEVILKADGDTYQPAQ